MKIYSKLVAKIRNNKTRIKTAVGIGNKRISEGSKSALGIRSGDLRKSGPGPRAKSDARRNAKAGKYSSGSTIIYNYRCRRICNYKL